MRKAVSNEASMSVAKPLLTASVMKRPGLFAVRPPADSPHAVASPEHEFRVFESKTFHDTGSDKARESEAGFRGLDD
jgi:hypothetical protein